MVVADLVEPVGVMEMGGGKRGLSKRGFNEGAHNSSTVVEAINW